MMKIGAIFIIIRRSEGYVLDRLFTERTDHIVNTFGPNGFGTHLMER